MRCGNLYDREQEFDPKYSMGMGTKPSSVGKKEWELLMEVGGNGNKNSTFD